MKAFRETPPRRIIIDRKSMAKRRAMLRPRLSNFFEKKMTTINILLLEASVVVELVTIFH